jgi:CheY-like chemotaxis protein
MLRRVLIAAVAEGAIALERILTGRDCTVVNTMRAAVAKLGDEAFDLIVVSLHFDDSQMFEFIREVKKSQKNADKPIICFCARDTPISRLMNESLELSTKALGAWMYLAEHSYNVYQNPDAELRRIMERCFTEESRKDIQHQRVVIETQRAELQKLRNLLQGQEWTPEMQEYLDGLQRDLELLLIEVTRLHSAADVQAASVTASRDLKDRVSNQVTTTENSMTSSEETQAANETSQSAGEEKLAAQEGIKKAEGKRKQQDKLERS